MGKKNAFYVNFVKKKNPQDLPFYGIVRKAEGER